MGLRGFKHASSLTEKLKIKGVYEMKNIMFPQSMNMEGPEIKVLQEFLLSLQYELDESEVTQSYFGKSTEFAVIHFQQKIGITPTGMVDELTAKEMNEIINSAGGRKLKVKGRVLNRLGEGVSSFTVKLYKKELRNEICLAENATDEDGHYEILYEMEEQISKPLHIFVGVFDQTGKEWMRSNIIYDAKEEESIILMEGGKEYKGFPEFDVLINKLSPFLNGLSIENLTENEQEKDVSYLLNATELNSSQLMQLIASHLVAKKIDVDPSILYAFFKQNLPIGLSKLEKVTKDFKHMDKVIDSLIDGILSLSKEMQTNTLHRAIEENYISIRFEEQIENLIEHFKQLRIDRALDKPFMNGKTPIRTFLKIALPDESLQKKFMELYLQENGNLGKVFSVLKKKDEYPQFSQLLNDLELIFEIGPLTKMHLPVVVHLKEMIQSGKVTSLKEFARYDEEEWFQLLKEFNSEEVTYYPNNLDGEFEDDIIKKYSIILKNQFEMRYPTTAIAALIARDEELNKEEVNHFFNKAENINLKKINIDRFLQENVDSLFDAPDKKDEVINDIKKIQRVMRLTPSVPASIELLKNNVHSSKQIYFMGKDRFVKEFATGPISKRMAKGIYKRASKTYAVMLNKLTQFNEALNVGTPRVITSMLLSEDEKRLLEPFEGLKTLFGSADYCSCEHCNSVYSPAAYLVDLLRFLENRSVHNGKTAKDILFQRRADLGTILLNCENTNIEMPYIDLVCEILENAISPSGMTFQTTGTSEELHASPAYENIDAYLKLKDEVFPFSLPFHLWNEEARLYLTQLGIKRYKLMELFQQEVTNHWHPQDVEIAAEFLGMTLKEQQIVCNEDLVNQPIYWGTTDPVIDLEIVSVFLNKSGLSYLELLDLLECSFINANLPKSEIKDKNTCDTNKQSITNLTINKLDRMHRFIRLWRKTGWKIFELDQIIISPSIGNGDINNKLLEQIKLFKELEGKLHLTVEQLLSFYQPISIMKKMYNGELENSLYERLFLNKTIINPLDEAFALNKVTDENTNVFIVDHKQVILAALMLQEKELDLLLHTIKQPNEEKAKLTLGNLSILYRYSLLNKSLNLSVENFLLLEELSTQLHPPIKSFKGLKETTDFIQMYEDIQNSKFDLELIDYLLNGNKHASVVGNEEFKQKIEQLRNELEKVKEDNYQFIILDYVQKVFHIDAEQANLLLNSNSLQIDEKVLLEHLKDKKIVEKNTSGNYLYEALPSLFPFIYDTFLLLDKITRVIHKLQISSSELKWLLENAAAFGLLEFEKIPIKKGQNPVPFSLLKKLVQLFTFKNRYPERNGVSIFTILDLTKQNSLTLEDFRAKIVEFMRWDLALMILMEGKLTIFSPKDYSIENLLRIEQCFKMMNMIGVNANTMHNLSKLDLDNNDVNAVKLSMKAQYQEKQWLEVSSNIQDQMRDKKREAMVQYLVHSPIAINGENIWQNAEGLFGYFLIDVEMSSCQKTTRILQAISTIQLFIQRCLMNLENPQVTINEQDDGWKQWKWMKNYRVWEANRKVFLYPENWIEPQLRDDKSPLFKDLENELLQNDLTEENVENAFLRYLEKLDDISRLLVCGLYHQNDSGKEIIHVIAKTKDLPPLYYYRKYVIIDGTGTWTSWEKVEVDIQTDHLIPVIYQRKLFLFWLELSEKPYEYQEIPQAVAGTNPQKPEKYWEVQLGYSYYRNGKWAPKVLAEKKLYFPIAAFLPSDISLKTYENYHSLSLEIFENYQGYPIGEFVFNGNVTHNRIRNKHLLHKELHDKVEGIEFPTWWKIEKPVGQSYQYNYLVHSEYDSSNNLFALKPSDRVDDGLIFQNASKPYYVTLPNQEFQFTSDHPFFYHDNQRGYFIIPTYLWRHENQSGTYWFSETLPSNVDLILLPPYKVRYTFYPFSHSLTSLFIMELNRVGIEGILNRNIQLRPETYPLFNNFKFDSYQPSFLVTFNIDNEDRNKEFVDFSYSGAYSVYNWELFFHAPLFIACKLSQDLKFEEAMKWFHYIFDPTVVSEEKSRQKYWKTKPFYLTSDEDYRKQQIEEMMKLVADQDVNVLAAINAWRNNPFMPHLIARTRTVAYQKAVVMKYIDNILAYADHLFRRNTFESINEATQLYVLAAVILGPKPKEIPRKKRESISYNDLSEDISRNVIAIENIVHPGELQEVSDARDMDLPNFETQSFCIPTNDKLLSYWDKVADRLFKIRHCQNIEGISRELRLFDPPIDPGKLVEAVHAGMDISDALGGIVYKEGPRYRFPVIAKKAIELCTELKSLGSALLSALEKRDAEALALLRSSQELMLLEKEKDLKKLQIDESQYALEALVKLKETNEAKRDYYKNIVKVSEGEKLYKDKLGEALDWQQAAQVANTGAALAHLIPDVDAGVVGFGGTPTAKFKFGGSQLGSSLQAVAGGLTIMANIANYHANMASIESGHERRWEEWKQQELIANKELLQIERQIEGAKVRKNIADLELKKHEKQIEQSQSVDEYMRNKYTNQELYDWMVTQISTVYMQNYQLAYDLAKKAEQCFQYELGIDSSSYISFGYWNSLKKGLLAGEKLFYDINRMESAYLELNKRQYELTKPISLSQLDPVALMTLKETGECFVNLPETLFDMDYPGHFFRRIKSVGITIPAVVGPNTSISCTLTLLDDSIRKTAEISDPDKYERNTDNPADDKRFADKLGINFGITQSIATSNALNDHGMFELNFRDERYLPFEGAGAISSWRIQLNKDFKQFDYQTISDVILHLKYTSENGGDTLRNAVIKSIDQKLNKIALANNRNGLYRLFSVKHEFSNEWNKFLNLAGLNEEQILRLPLVKERFPLFTKNFDIKITKIQFIGNFSKTEDYNLKFSISTISKEEVPFIKQKKHEVFGNLHITPEIELSDVALGDINIKVKKGDLQDHSPLVKDELEDIFIILQYKLVPKA